MAASGCNAADLRLVSDASLAWHHPADDPNVGYGFCRECGASLFWKAGKGEPHQTDTISICAGTLDMPSGLHTERAIFVDDAADYHSVDLTIPSEGGEQADQVRID